MRSAVKCVTWNRLKSDAGIDVSSYTFWHFSYTQISNNSEHIQICEFFSGFKSNVPFYTPQSMYSVQEEIKHHEHKPVYQIPQVVSTGAQTNKLTSKILRTNKSA